MKRIFVFMLLTIGFVLTFNLLAQKTEPLKMDDMIMYEPTFTEIDAETPDAVKTKYNEIITRLMSKPEMLSAENFSEQMLESELMIAFPDGNFKMSEPSAIFYLGFALLRKNAELSLQLDDKLMSESMMFNCLGKYAEALKSAHGLDAKLPILSSGKPGGEMLMSAQPTMEEMKAMWGKMGLKNPDQLSKSEASQVMEQTSQKLNNLLANLNNFTNLKSKFENIASSLKNVIVLKFPEVQFERQNKDKRDIERIR